MKIQVAFKEKEIPTEIHNIENGMCHIQIVNYLNDHYGENNWFAYFIMKENLKLCVTCGIRVRDKDSLGGKCSSCMTYDFYNK